MILSDHPVWSVLTEDLVLDLLDLIPHMTQYLTKALVRFSLILLQHPKAGPLISKWDAFYLDKSGPFWSVAGSISSGPGSTAVTGNVNSTGGVEHPHHNQTPAAVPEGLVAPSGGVCCRNGTRVGLRGSIASRAGARDIATCSSGGEKRKDRVDVGEDAGDGGVRPNKRNKGSEDVDGGSVRDSCEIEGDKASCGGGEAPGRSGKTRGRGGKTPGRGGKASGRGRKASGNKTAGADSTSESTATWMTDGTPPRLNEGARYLFARLATLHSDAAMMSLASLLRDLISGASSDVDLTGYDLGFSSLLSQCAKLSATKAARDFHAAILYIRLAIHIDQ